MTVSLTTTGNGRFVVGNQSGVVTDYSYSESITPLSLDSSTGDIPTMSIVAKSNNLDTLGMTHPTSKLLIGNQITFTDSLRGSFEGKVVSVSIDRDTASTTSVSVFDKLNKTKYMKAKSDTITNVFKAYLLDAGLTSGQMDVVVSSSNIVTPPWKMTYLKALKFLCATVQAEMYFMDGKVVIRPVASKQITINNSEISTFNVEIPAPVERTKYRVSKTKFTSGAIAFVSEKNSTIFTVDFNESKEESLKTTMAIDSIATPEYVAQVPSTVFFPEYTDYIQKSSIGTVPSVYTNGFYSFYDKNNNIVEADKLAGAGLKLELTDDPYEIKMTIIGPNTSATTPWALAFSSKDPALGIVASGTVVEAEVIETHTGIVDDSVDDSESTDYTENPFMVTTSYARDLIYRTNQRVAGPNVKIGISTNAVDEAGSEEFGYLPGAIFSWEGSKYRIIDVEYSYGAINITAEQYVTFADFNTLWAGKTFDDFTDAMFTPTSAPDEFMTHNDFATIPLMEPV